MHFATHRCLLSKKCSLAALVLVLTSCGGSSGDCHSPTVVGGTVQATCSNGNGGSSSSTSASLVLSPDCTGSNCGSSDASTYSGTGVGVWTSSNLSSSPATASINLSGMENKTVTLLWTNTTDQQQVSAPASAAYIQQNGDNPTLTRQRAKLDANLALLKKKLPQTNQSLLSRSLLKLPAPSYAYAAGDTHDWYDSVNSRSASTTLRSQATLSNGSMVNIWVEDSQWDPAGSAFKITQAMANLLRDKFAASSTGIYDMVTSLTAGKPWGAHGNASLIGATQDIQIVVSNLTPDSSPSGLLGYFDGINSTLKIADPLYANSNEAMMFFVDSETLASPTQTAFYQASIVSALAHEFVHMINFYERFILKSTSTTTVIFDGWLEEITAMMAQDMVDLNLTAPNHNLRDNWFSGWVANGAYNCSLTEYVSSGACFSYDIGGSYGGYLLRQYGVKFYQDLLQSTETNSITALDNTIRKYAPDGAGFTTTLRRWGAAMALLDSTTLPAGFGYPARSFSLGGVTYTLPAINGPSYASQRIISPLPASLKPYAHAVQSLSSPNTSFSRRVTLPAGAELTVVVN